MRCKLFRDSNSFPFDNEFAFIKNLGKCVLANFLHENDTSKAPEEIVAQMDRGDKSDFFQG